MPRALIYCRVSTGEQAREGYSLDAQEKFCRKCAENNGYRVTAVYRDEGKGGANLDRLVLPDLLARSENHLHHFFLYRLATQKPVTLL